MGTTKRGKALLLRDAVGNDTILFEERDGIYWLRGSSLSRMLSILKQPNYADAVGWDFLTFMLYAKQLLERRVKVGVAAGNTVRILQSQKNRHLKVESTPIWLAGEFLEDRPELEHLAKSKKMSSPAIQELVAALKSLLQRDNTSEIATFGTIYVLRVADNMYEVDERLTTMPRDVLDAFLLASYQTGRVLRCQLVQPKPLRGKHHISIKPDFLTVSQPVTYGQLRFEL